MQPALVDPPPVIRQTVIARLHRDVVMAIAFHRPVLIYMHPVNQRDVGREEAVGKVFHFHLDV